MRAGLLALLVAATSPAHAQAADGPAPLPKPVSVVERGRATQPAVDTSLWYDLRELEIEGKGWEDTAHFYDRLPAYLPERRERSRAKNAELEQAFRELAAAGARKIFYIPGASLLGDDDEATVDGTHPSDLGFMRMADAMEPVLRQAAAAAPGDGR